MDVINKISVLLKDQGLKQKELTDYLGLSKNIFSEWKSGRATSYMKYLPQIAKFLNVPIDTLIDPSEPQKQQKLNTSDLFCGLGKIASSEPPQFTASDINTNIAYVPLYESVSAGCGVYADSVPVGYVPIMAIDDNEQYFCVKVKGDSMSPRIENGDIVIVRRQEVAEDGQVAVVMVGDEGLVKRVFFGNNRMTLKSYNHDYDDRIYTNEELNEIRICGVVVQLIKTF